jgi:hypothetical protein
MELICTVMACGIPHRLFFSEDFGMKRIRQVLLVMLAGIALPAGAMAVEINAGMNDTWSNLDTNGQGFFVTVFPDIQQMFVGWFTYDIERPPANVTAILGDPGHRWLTAFGPFSGDTATLVIELTQGGIFDSAEPDPATGPDGTMTVTFTSCSEGTVTFNIPSVPVSGTIPVTRVANDNVPVCEALSEQ